MRPDRRNGRWFHLARCFDVDYSERGPHALARFLGLDVDEVFPVAYDMRRYAKGDASALVGTVDKEPREKLSRQELTWLAVPTIDEVLFSRAQSLPPFRR